MGSHLGLWMLLGRSVLRRQSWELFPEGIVRLLLLPHLGVVLSLS